MKTIAEAQAQLWAQAAAPTQSERQPVATANGRVLAESIIADLDVPPAANSAMDGYALRAQDGNQLLAISQRIVAGMAPLPLATGTVARIFTGGEIPEGADAVVMQENTRLDGVTLEILKTPSPGDNIRPKGQDIAAKSVVLTKGTRLGVVELGLLASQGLSDVLVYRSLRVALVNSGSELIEPGEPLQPGQIYNSNGAFLAALLQQMGCKLSRFKLADSLKATRQLLAELAQTQDVILTTGGVSAGEEDHIKTAVAALGQVELWKVAMKPGKPFMFGRIGGTPILGLPGNPVSAFVTFLIFAKPFIERMQGSQGQMPLPYALPLLGERVHGGARAELLRVQRSAEGLLPFDNSSSGVLRSLAWAHGLALIPAGGQVRPGDRVDYWSLQELLALH